MDVDLRRKGGNGAFTRLFDDLSISEQDGLRSELLIRDAEEPVIGSYRNPENWFVLTTDRLAWSVSGERTEFDVNVIRDVTVDLRELQRSIPSKLQMEELRILTLDADNFAIRVEPGPPLSGVWSVLKNVGARNRHKLRR